MSGLQITDHELMLDLCLLDTTHRSVLVLSNKTGCRQTEGIHRTRRGGKTSQRPQIARLRDLGAVVLNQACVLSIRS